MQRLISQICCLLLAFSPLARAIAQDAAPAPWELRAYRIQVLVAVESSASLPPKLEEELTSDLPARAVSTMGGAWRLECTSAPTELRHAILHSPGRLTSEDVPAAAKKGDKVILLGVSTGEN